MVRVTDGDVTFDDIDEPGYRLSLIKPPLEELPWCASQGVKPIADYGKD